tara:strand:- start:537 stop:752 length:216 start_codon:yes stop_codon:yes gene_type:complete
MKKGRLQEIVKELQGASEMHLKQSKEIKSHIDEMGAAKKKTSCWKGYSNIVNGKPKFKKKGKKMVPDCKPI